MRSVTTYMKTLAPEERMLDMAVKLRPADRERLHQYAVDEKLKDSTLGRAIILKTLDAEGY